MGQRNLKTIIKNINSGELSEYIFALSIIAKTTKSSLMDVHTSFSANKCVEGTHSGITFYGDGKMVNAYLEMSQYFQNNTTDFVCGLVEKVREMVHTITLEPYDSVYCCGGSSDKADVLTKLNGKNVGAYSLKNGHNNSERSQSPSWNSAKSFYGKFCDVSFFENTYDSYFQEFTKPAYRYSRAKGDWSPELRSNAELMYKCVSEFEKAICEKFVAGDFDSKQFATNVIKTFTGDIPYIYFIEFEEQKCKLIRQELAAQLEQVILNSSITYEQSKTSTGRTNDTYVYLDGIKFMHFRTTASADEAKPIHGNVTKDKNLRRIKRQTYLWINVDYITSL